MRKTITQVLTPLLLAAGLVGCGSNSNTATAPVTVTQPVTVFGTATPSSAAGAVWRQALVSTYSPPSSQFTARTDHSSVSFSGALWVIGGDDGAYLNDAWKSADGTHWTQVLTDTASPATSQFTERRGQAVAVMGGWMWLVGGYDGSHYLNDVWKSSDGASWTRVLADNASPGSSQFPERAWHSLVAANGYLWLFAGYDGSTYWNDAWKSSDGVTWTRVLTASVSPTGAQFTGRDAQSAVAFKGALWMAGGFNGYSQMNDVWNSTDGASWTQVLPDRSSPPSSQFPQRSNQMMAVYDPSTGLDQGGELWILGGFNPNTSPVYLSDVWSSPDGANWSEHSVSAAFPGRMGATAGVLDGSLWVMGGNDGGFYFNDVWSTP
ncbi:MAG TPA: kelch repeat-containing protein [bacterium]|nr:kelch repeat-containing protein [bacterium]